MTQAELAAKTGTTKSYISKIENNIKEARISTLQKIVKLGLDGQLKLSIQRDSFVVDNSKKTKITVNRYFLFLGPEAIRIKNWV